MSINYMTHQAAMGDHWAAVKKQFDQSDPGCVSADTEFLTPFGWKRIDQYTDGDKVMQWDLTTRIASFVRPTEFIKEPNESFIHFKNSRGSDQVLSPEHRVLTFNRSGNPNVISAKDILEQHVKSPNGFQDARVATTFITEVPKKRINATDDELRLAVAIMADGHLSNISTKHVTFRLKRKEKIERLNNLLDRLDIDAKHRLCNSAPGFHVISFYAPAITHRKRPEPYWFHESTDAQREIFVDESQYWDGAIDKRGTGSYRFSTTDETTADFLQFCAATTGRTATISRDLRTDKYTNGVCYNVHIQSKAIHTTLVGKNPYKGYEIVSSKDGFKYCFSVPSTFWVMRHNGKIAITGNTGKTIGTLAGYERTYTGGRMLVLAPLSILKSSWGDDITKHGRFTYAIAHGSPKKRLAAFNSTANIVIMNHDGVKWLAENLHLLDGFTHLDVDESTAFKNSQSQRSKAVAKLVQRFEYVRIMTGTPNPNTVLDLWHQVKLLDNGKRLGAFYQFRNACCDPEQVGPSAEMKVWRDKPGAVEYVADKIKDITIRFRREDCLDLPERSFHTMLLDCPAWLFKKYKEFQEHSVLETDDGQTIVGVHASARVRKLLQMLSGAVYDEDGEPVRVHSDRYELVMQLIDERAQCIVAFNWRHELDALTKAADKWGFSFGVINGDTPANRRAELVTAFQQGQLRVIFAHPQSAGHGLTMTAATTTIWCSPTYNSEHYEQFNARFYRAGQTKKTEVIRIAYRDTKEVDVYEKLDGKLFHMEDLLTMLTDLNPKKDKAA